MSLTSAIFLPFFLGALIIFYVLPKKTRWFWLLIISLIFFSWSDGWKTLPYLFYGIVVTYFGARIIQRYESEKKRKTILFLTVFLSLFVLGALKETNFFIHLINGTGGLFGISPGLGMVNIIAPIGISYFTLSLIGYVIDVNRNVCKAQTNILKHALFTCYFPQLISGPILRYGEMENQLFSDHRLDLNNISYGFTRILWGFFKKMVIADRLAILVNTVYGDYTNYPGMYIFIATLCYAFQLYTDFSGCMDIVLGASEAFGIKLPENFKAPFFSERISEFWRRWHITLGLWFKDYLLYPLLKGDFLQGVGQKSKKLFGKKKGKNIPTYLGLSVVWLCVGLWHGGSVKYFFASGILPCVYLISSELLSPFFKRIIEVLKINTECFSYRLFSRFRTLMLMCLCWVFVCAQSFTDGLHVLKSMFTTFNPLILVDNSLFTLGLDQQDIIVVIFGILAVMVVDYMINKEINVRDFLGKQNFAFKCIVVWTQVLFIMFFGIMGASSFIYFQF